MLLTVACIFLVMLIASNPGRSGVAASTYKKLGHWKAESGIENRTVAITLTYDKQSTYYQVAIDIMDRDCPSTWDLLKLFPSDSNNIKDLVNILTALHIGPDELYVQIEGRSIQTLVAGAVTDANQKLQTAGSPIDRYCGLYNAYFKVPIDGPYRLKVFRLRRDYRSVATDDTNFQMIDYEAFIDILLPFQLRSSVNMSSICRADLGNGFFTTNEPKVFLDRPITLKRLFEDSVSLSHLHIESYIRLYHRLEVAWGFDSKNCSDDADYFSWNSSACLDESQEGRTATQLLTELETLHGDYSTMFQGKSILFVGDSHMRGLADIFLWHICRVKVRDISLYVKDMKAIQTVALNASYSNIGKCPVMNVSYIGEYVCGSEIIHEINGKRFDYIVVNCGHHPASGRFHYSYSQYQSAVKRMLSELIPYREGFVNQEERPRIFWLENTAQPIRVDDYVIKFQDWRTNHRLIMFDYIAKRELAAHSVSVIGAFKSTLAVFDKMCDNQHYPFNIKIAQVNSLIMQLLMRNH